MTADPKPIGSIDHFFDQLGVGVVKLETGKLKVGDKVRIKGATTDFEQIIKSLQIDKNKVESIEKGQDAGVKLDEKARQGDKVYKVS